MPDLTAQWLNGSEQHHIAAGCLERAPVFDTFDDNFFHRNLLPQEPIDYRNEPTKSVTGALLSQQIEQLRQEIDIGKKRFTHFTIIADGGFNHKTRSGLIILKFKQYPFILKLFIETPQSFTRPRSKGFEQMGIFNLGGGMNRHLLGFTRIKNAHAIRKIIKRSPIWAKRADVPRKWFWQPKNRHWIKLTGTNFSQQKIETCIPATYGIVADRIEIERTLSFIKQKDRHLGMKISNALQSRIDPNISNFIIEKNTHKIVIIDTEHFPLLAGLKKPQRFKSYLSWYAKLGVKFMKGVFLRTKKERHRIS